MIGAGVNPAHRIVAQARSYPVEHAWPGCFSGLGMHRPETPLIMGHAPQAITGEPDSQNRCRQRYAGQAFLGNTLQMAGIM